MYNETWYVTECPTKPDHNDLSGNCNIPEPHVKDLTKRYEMYVMKWSVMKYSKSITKFVVIM